ncbi:unnamed protein product [Rotaria magnacalcarata]|uniref:Bromo domain-containing protein n=1 Tax=Rotaria magnacalcarata TaxID=392030 RepID=A0A8S2XWX2_9BILA|nr:unnamed protein product [Rotaria magnacalcarata]CAF4526901.1 unnamed protein product [Rotaria magnacalcarata]
MSIIKDKMDKGIYKPEQDIIEDLDRMFNNAKVYNIDESYKFKYASRLEQALANKYKTTHVFHYDETVAQLRSDCDRTVTRNCEKLRRSYA